MPDYSLYVSITLYCIRAVSFCALQLQEEMSQLSLLALWRVCEIKGSTLIFWNLTSTIIEMLYDQVSHEYLMAKTVTNECQNLTEQFPHLITDLATVCFEAFHKADPPDETVTLLAYEARHFHTLQVDASNSVSAFYIPYVQQQIRSVIERIVTLHPQRHRLEFTGWHYAVVASRSLARCRYAYSR